MLATLDQAIQQKFRILSTVLNIGFNKHSIAPMQVHFKLFRNLYTVGEIGVPAVTLENQA